MTISSEEFVRQRVIEVLSNHQGKVVNTWMNDRTRNMPDQDTNELVDGLVNLYFDLKKLRGEL